MAPEDRSAWHRTSAFIREHQDEAQRAPLPLSPGRLTQRDEANVLTAYAFRNGFLEDLHAGWAGFSDEEMKKLMIEASAHLASLLHVRQVHPALYVEFLVEYGSLFCRGWSQQALTHPLSTPPRRPCPSCQQEVRIQWRFCACCGAKLFAT